jgi:hypothetical protein
MSEPVCYIGDCLLHFGRALPQFLCFQLYYRIEEFDILPLILAPQIPLGSRRRLFYNLPDTPVMIFYIDPVTDILPSP